MDGVWFLQTEFKNKIESRENDAVPSFSLDRI